MEPFAADVETVLNRRHDSGAIYRVSPDGRIYVGIRDVHLE